MILKAAGTPVQRHASPALAVTLRHQTAMPPRLTSKSPIRSQVRPHSEALLPVEEGLLRHNGLQLPSSCRFQQMLFNCCGDVDGYGVADSPCHGRAGTRRFAPGRERLDRG